MFNGKILFLVGLVACLNGQVLSFSCKNEKGENVDWFILFKAPRKAGDSDARFEAGGAYGYIDNKATDSGWLLAQKDIGDEKSAIGRTFEEVYKSPEKYSYIQYNDAKPEGTGSDSITNAHAKGAIVWNNKDAVWIIHSVPKFLPIFHSNKYEYPEGGKIYGQNFLCISLNPQENVKKILDHIVKMRAAIYGNHISSKLSKKLAEEIQENINIIASKMKKSLSTEPKETITEVTDEMLDELNTEITSKGGEKFKVITKSRKHEVDIWQKVAQPILKVKEFMVKYWVKLQKATALLQSQCSLTRTLNAVDMEMKFKNDDRLVTWGENDHSKWGLCGKKENCYCAGDMNRATSQFHRGGGVVCIFDKNVHDTFEGMIATYADCDNEEVPFIQNDSKK